MSYKFRMSWTLKDGTRVADQIYTAEAVSGQLVQLESWEATDIKVEWMPPAPKVEVIYTGGGIWLACKNLDENRYAIVGDDFEEGIAIYDRRGETPYKGDEWPCQNMVECYTDDELKSSNMWGLFKIYKDMLKQLHKERW